MRINQTHRLIIPIVFTALYFGSVLVAAAQPEEPAKKRPKIGLVLAGGGALGFAHIGVLKVMEANRIPVDLVTGTSMGSIVGAAYASGVKLEEMETLLSTTDWDALFNESSPRRDVPYRFKAGRNRELFGDTKIGFDKEGKIAIPAGVVQGQHVLPLLQRLYDKVPTPVEFDKLPLPFRAVAADIETGHPVIPSSGNLPTIVRASMSVPGFFAPVEWDGKLLVDGGISNNLPVDVALQMGADVLIVVELYCDLKKRAELENPLAVSGQIVSLLLAQNSALQKKLMRPGDVFVAPDLHGLSATDFPKGPEIIKRGEDAALKIVNELKALSIDEADYKEYQAKRTAELRKPRIIDAIVVKNTSYITDETILAKLGVTEGETIDRQKIDKGLNRIYDLGQFSEVTYETLDNEKGTKLVVDAKEKDWLHDYYRIGASLEDDFEGNSSFRLGLNYRATDVSINGSYAEVEGEIGRSPKFKAELYQPLANGSPYFVSPQAYIGRTNIQVRQDNDIVAEYDRLNGFLGTSVGREIGELGEFRIGYRRGFGEVDRRVGDPTLPDFSYDIGDTYAILDLDALDTVDFPKEGYLLRLAQRSSIEELGASETFNDVGALGTLPITFGRNTLTFRGDTGITFQDRPVENSYALGGFLDVSGYAPGSLVASDYGVGRAVFYHRFSELKTPFFHFDFFAGGNMEIATLRSDVESIPDNSLIVAGGAFIGADTPLLPTYFGVGFNNDSEAALYLVIGRLSPPERQ